MEIHKIKIQSYFQNKVNMAGPRTYFCRWAPLLAQMAKNLPAEDPGSIPGLGRSHGEGNDNPFQYSCLENSIDRGAWTVTVHGVTKNQTQLND